MELLPVSRTIGTDQLFGEMVIRFTHTSGIDRMLPGVAPTGRRVTVPPVAIVRFRDGKVAHEHICRNQASVLVRIGAPEPGRLPVAGAETARKVMDKGRPSNTLMAAWANS